MTTDTVSNTVNKDLVETFIQELFTKGNLDAVDQYLDPTLVNHDPPFPGAPDGPEGMRQAAAMFRRALPDWHSDVEELVGEGDIVVERFTASGTHRGELMGVAATGRVIVLRGIQMFRIENSHDRRALGKTRRARAPPSTRTCTPNEAPQSTLAAGL